jgi:hypothetical protein
MFDAALDAADQAAFGAKDRMSNGHGLASNIA